MPADSHLVGRGLERRHAVAQGLDGLLQVPHVRGPQEGAAFAFGEWVGIGDRAVATAAPPNALFLVQVEQELEWRQRGCVWGVRV